MMKLNKLMIAGFIVVVSCCMFLSIGCSPEQPNGTLTPNLAPWVRWSSTVVDTLNSQNPLLRWFSGDTDGRVVEFQYSVLLADSINYDPEAAMLDFPEYAAWRTVPGQVSQVRPFLFSSTDTSVYVPQYVFLRAVDDDDAASTMIYIYVKRKNHAPTCAVEVPFTIIGTTRYIVPQWCLADTNGRWSGIRVSWGGKDSLDYPETQPDFEWNIRIYGPFEDSLSMDTLQAPIKYLKAFKDSTGAIDSTVFVDNPGGDEAFNEWITATSARIKNLETGVYMLYAVNRDDAFVLAQVPARGILEIYEPEWLAQPDYNRILLVDHNWFGTFPPGELRTPFRDSVNQFYRQMLDDAGYAGMYDTFYTNDISPIMVTNQVLYRYSLVIASDIDMSRMVGWAAGKDQQLAYQEYLDVGGKLWVVGRRSFELSTSGQTSLLVEYSTTGLAYLQMGLNGAYTNKLTQFDDARFIGAAPLALGFPDVLLDTLHVSYTSDADNDPHYSIALRGIETLMTNPGTETIYKYVALYPDSTIYHNLPVAVRYETNIFKTSYFSFPLYFIEQGAAVTITQQMINWFLTE